MPPADTAPPSDEQPEPYVSLPTARSAQLKQEDTPLHTLIHCGGGYTFGVATMGNIVFLKRLNIELPSNPDISGPEDMTSYCRDICTFLLSLLYPQQPMEQNNLDVHPLADNESGACVLYKWLLFSCKAK